MGRNGFQARGMTLNQLKGELYSLNRRMLLALQNHDETEQGRIKQAIEKVQEKIILFLDKKV